MPTLSHVIPAKAGIYLAEVDPRFRGGDDKFRWFGWTGRSMSTRSNAGANRAKSGSVNFSRRPSMRTAEEKTERKGPRSFDAAIKYGTVAMMVTGKTRTRHSQWRSVRATCSIFLDMIACVSELMLNDKTPNAELRRVLLRLDRPVRVSALVRLHAGFNDSSEALWCVSWGRRGLRSGAELT